MILKSCGRCGNLMPYGATYCSLCKPLVEAEIELRKQTAQKESNRRYNRKRNPKYLIFYNSIEWRTLSAKYLQDQGYRCEVCGAIATQVHHMTPIQTDEGWEHRLEYDKLKALCVRCHNETHDRFQRKKK
ncbi:HNH endonuclease [Anaerovoracaceae bacterium 41-7]|uniref:HNH endonuclease n=1 Tax=Emergencia sp. JLR.KK010 TaxID=3114296 RepID=UPI0030CD5075